MIVRRLKTAKKHLNITHALMMLHLTPFMVDSYLVNIDRHHCIVAVFSATSWVLPNVDADSQDCPPTGEVRSGKKRKRTGAERVAKKAALKHDFGRWRLNFADWELLIKMLTTNKVRVKERDGHRKVPPNETLMGV